ILNTSGITATAAVSVDNPSITASIGPIQATIGGSGSQVKLGATIGISDATAFPASEGPASLSNFHFGWGGLLVDCGTVNGTFSTHVHGACANLPLTVNTHPISGNIGFRADLSNLGQDTGASGS